MQAALGSRGAGRLTGGLQNRLTDGLGLFLFFTPLTEVGKKTALVKV
jgi:hypothetical protein